MAKEVVKNKNSDVGSSASELSKEKYTVVKPFYDVKKPGEVFRVGDDVSHFDESRLANCIEKGLVKKV